MYSERDYEQTDLSYSLSAKTLKKNCTNFLQQCTKVWDFSEHLFIYKNKIPLFKLPLGLPPPLFLVNIGSRNCAAPFSVSSLCLVAARRMFSLQWALDLEIHIASSLTFPRADGHVNTTASSCVHTRDDLRPAREPLHSAPLCRAGSTGVFSGKKIHLLFKEDGHSRT